MRLPSPALVVLPLLLLAPPAGAGPEPAPAAPVLTAHYELVTAAPPDQAREWGRVLEAAWPLFEAHFGRAPDLRPGERLKVVVARDATDWAAAIRQGGGIPPGGASGAGGYYDPVSRGAYLYPQPTVWYTRALLLHEAAHQFHFLAATSNRSPPAGWYVEGLAEHLSHHTWDGSTLRLGVVPLLSLEDRPARALEALGAPGFRLDPIVSGAAAPRPESLHLVRYLLQGEGGRHAARFRSLAGKLDRGGSSAALFARAFGPEAPFLEAWSGWLRTVQQPWVGVHLEWEARGERVLRGRSAVVGTCRVRGPARRVQTLWSPPAGPWRAGALLQHAGVDDFTVGLVDGATVRVHRRRAGRWEALPASLPPAPAPGEPWRLTAERRGTQVALTVNGVRVGAYDLPGDALGLAVDGCEIDFRELSWEGGGRGP